MRSALVDVRQVRHHAPAFDSARAPHRPLPGRLAHHSRIVSSDHPAFGPIRTSGSGIRPCAA